MRPPPSFRYVRQISSMCENLRNRGIGGRIRPYVHCMIQRTNAVNTHKRFILKAEADRTHPFDGTPLRQLPEWGGVARTEGAQFVLHPPLDFQIAYKIPQYMVFAPFSRAVAELSIEDEPKHRKTWSAGSAFVVPPETTVRTRMTEPVEFLCLIMSAERAEQVFNRVAQGRHWAPCVIEHLSDAGFSALHREVRRSLLGDPIIEPGYLGAVGDAMFARIGCHFAGLPLSGEPREALAPHVLRKIGQLVDQRLAGKISVEDLADEAGFSRSHFSRAFQASTGEPPQDFIIGRRISRAREMLADTDRPIAAIATATGFSSQAHLSSTFKKRLGVAPGAYRSSFSRV